ncbi:MAG TPA: NUDIX domain-containing protein [Pseudonocardiaceae bacterium]|nr:NUDIX domain-containing protein [Pseudonocardiaceae bacterium]
MSAPLEIITRAVIIRAGQLLVARDLAASWYFLPGGHVESGEPVEAALLRELGEELGCGATVVGFVGAVEYGYVSGGCARRELNLVFEVDLDAAAPKSQEDHLEFCWVPMAGLAQTALRPEPLRTGVQQWAENRVPFWRALSL